MASNNDSYDDTSEEEPSTKKLRSVESDLKIIVGDSPTNDNGRCEYWYNAAVMATQSGFIDTLLVSPMMESITREIKLPDVEPKTWDLAMKFLDLEIRKMTMEDAVEIVALYDKYDFHRGLKLCNYVIGEGFEAPLTEGMINKINADPTAMTNFLVRALVLCDSCNLEDARRRAYFFFNEVLHDQTLRLLFNEEQLREVLPVFLKAKETWQGALDDWCLVFPGWSTEDMANPIFARLLLTEWEFASCRVRSRSAPSIKALIPPNGKWWCHL